MTPDEAHAQIAEAKMRSDTMNITTVLLNLFHQYLDAENGSEIETLLEEELSKMIEELVDQGKRGLIGQVIFSMCAVICQATDPARIQEFLDDQSAEIQRLVDEAVDGHSH